MGTWLLSGAAGALTAVVCGLIFLGVFSIYLRVFSKRARIGGKLKSILESILPSVLDSKRLLDKEKTRIAIVKLFPDKWFAYEEPEINLYLNNLPGSEKRFPCYYKYSHSVFVTIVVGINETIIETINTEDLCHYIKNSDAVNPYR